VKIILAALLLSATAAHADTAGGIPMQQFNTFTDEVNAKMASAGDMSITSFKEFRNETLLVVCGYANGRRFALAAMDGTPDEVDIDAEAIKTCHKLGLK
jgi:hypothetical protein